MDSRIAVALALVVVGSGCTELMQQLPVDSGSEGEELPRSRPAAGKGLEVTKLQAVDSTLRPGQTTTVQLWMVNHHVSDLRLEALEPYNTGLLSPPGGDDEFDVECDNLEAPEGSPTDVPPSENGLNPEFRCQFTVKAPEQSEIEGFSDRRFNPRVRIAFQSRLINANDPYEMVFMPQTEIEQGSRKTASFSNGEVRMKVESDQPIPAEQGGRMSLDITSPGSGSVLSDQYTVSVSPAGIFGSCNGQDDVSGFSVEPAAEDHGEATCVVSARSDLEQRLTRQLVFATSYKYQLSPEFGITVQNYD